MPGRDDIFYGEFDPMRGWTNVRTSTSTGKSWTPGLFQPLNHPYGGLEDYEDPWDKPQLRGLSQHVMASTETALALLIEFIWDANGYYRAFGYRWPYLGISIKQMRLRYLEIDGPNSEWLTYILKTLRNPEQRRIYDRTPFWERYMDKYMEEWLKQLAIKKAQEWNNQKQFWQDEKTATDMLEELGFGIDEEPEDGDTPALPGLDEDPEDLPWMYAYYLWRSDCDDTWRLSRWQELIREELVAAGVKLRFAVGFVGHNPRRWVTGEVQGQRVFYLNQDHDPEPELARTCVAAYLRDERKEIENGE